MKEIDTYRLLREIEQRMKSACELKAPNKKNFSKEYIAKANALIQAIDNIKVYH